MDGEQKAIKFDLSSTVLEMGVDAARSFVGKLVSPSVEELGLLVRDQISLWRFANQVKILNKAKVICEKHQVNVKAISPKLLCPYLEYAALEEDDELQDKWAALLVNMVDSHQNMQSHVFPYILSQLSKDEFGLIEQAVLEMQARHAALELELKEYRETKPLLESQLKGEIARLDRLRAELRESGVGNLTKEYLSIMSERGSVQSRLGSLNLREYLIRRKLGADQPVESEAAEEFEMANIVRLGLAKVVFEASAGTHSIEIPNGDGYSRETVKFDVEIDTETSTVLTELGKLFVNACQETRR